MNIRGNSALSTLGKLYKIFNAGQKKQFNWLIVLTFISSISDLVGLYFIIPVVGLVLSPAYYNTLIHFAPFLSGFGKNELLLILVAIFFIIIIAKNAFGLYINRLQVTFVQNLFVTSSMNVLNKVYDRSVLEIQKTTSNELVNKLTSLQMTLCSYATIPAIILINESIIFALTTIVICAVNWHLFLLMACVVFPIMGFFYARVKNMIKTAGTEKNTKGIEIYAKGQEMVFGYMDIKIAGTERSFKKRFESLAKKYSVAQGKMDFMLFIPTRIIEIAIFLCICIILVYGVFVIKDISKIVATISAFSILAYRSIPSINRFIMAMNNLNAAEFIFKDPDFYLDESKKTDQPPVSPMPFSNSIRFENVSYKYPGTEKFVIENCNFEIKKGDKIGIVGKSGAGKSTLISNILGFLSPTNGHINIDSTLLTEDNVKQWWKILGYVRQEVFIMNTTLLENIAIGETPENVDMIRMNHAVRMSSLTELVSELPEGLNTILNERGNNLSGGQKQRIAIARAIYKGAEVLIFDEATSALDSKTEEEITNSIRQLGDANLTIIIIAHRYTSLKYCNKIYKIEKGHIDHTITYEELVNDMESTK